MNKKIRWVRTPKDRYCTIAGNLFLMSITLAACLFTLTLSIGVFSATIKLFFAN